VTDVTEYIVFVEATARSPVTDVTEYIMFVEATARNRCQTLCSSKVNWN